MMTEECKNTIGGGISAAKAIKTVHREEKQLIFINRIIVTTLQLLEILFRLARH